MRHSPSPRAPAAPPPGWQAPRLLARPDAPALASFLAADPRTNLFSLAWLENFGVNSAPGHPEFFFVGVHDTRARLVGAALTIAGSLLLVHARAEQPATTLGQWFAQQGFRLEHLVSETRCVAPFWQAYIDAFAPDTIRARLIQPQSFYFLERDTWHNPGPLPATNVRVRFARPEELDAVFLASARMHLEETGENPLDIDPAAFRQHVRQRIESRRCFVCVDAQRRLLFKADLSALSRHGAQIAGVYTAPQFRGQGIATRAIFDICRQLFEGDIRRVTLYVNDNNHAAQQVYRKVGFHFHTPYQTIFVDSDAV